MDFEVQKIVVHAKPRTLSMKWQLVESPKHGTNSAGFIVLPPPPEIRHLTSALMFPAFLLRIDDGELSPRAAEAMQWVKDSGFAHEFHVLSSNEAGLGFIDDTEAALFKLMWVEPGDAR